MTLQAPTLETIQEEIKRRKISKLFQMAERYGIIHRGFTGIDYLRHAIKNHGWESTSIGGIKGSAKSNLLWQRGYAIYQDWNIVNEHIVTEPEELVNIIAKP